MYGRSLGGVGRKILETYQENNSHLTNFHIMHANLRYGSSQYNDGGATEVTSTLERCSNLTHINLYYCNINAGILLPMVEAMRGLRSLEQLYLDLNDIRNAGCEALATLLEDPNSNLERLQIRENNIGNEGAISLVKSLSHNTKLKHLFLGQNPIDQLGVESDFYNLFCKTLSIKETHSSNHTLETVEVDNLDEWSLLDMNKDTNKSHVAIKKILIYHPDIDMTPLFGWDNDGEWTLKALPYVIAWFDKAWVVKASDLDERQVAVFVQEVERTRISRRKLSSIYKFAKAMPVRFVQADYVKMDEKKRKRVD